MPWLPRLLRHTWSVAAMLLTLVVDAGRFLRLWLRSPVASITAHRAQVHAQLSEPKSGHTYPVSALGNVCAQSWGMFGIRAKTGHNE